MIKTFATVTALGALLVTPVLAQGNTPASPPSAQPPAASSPSSQPSSSSTSSSSTEAKASEASKPTIISEQKPDQWLASSFKGTDVVGTDNKKIGDIDNILFDRDGKILAYVVGVGGFLGIGTKNVAIAPKSFQVVPANTGSNGNSSSSNANEVKLKLAMSADDLKKAPNFKEYKPPAKNNAATTGMAPGGARPAGGLH